jgi:hypothetical protein
MKGEARQLQLGRERGREEQEKKEEGEVLRTSGVKLWGRLFMHHGGYI